jgi:hypothetical protein
MNALSDQPDTTASATPSPNSHKMSRKRYLHLIDQQLKDMDLHINRLQVKKRSLKGSERDRLSDNIRLLEGKLSEARRLWTQIMNSDAEWLTRKKVLDAKVIRLQKSLTYVTNTL